MLEKFADEISHLEKEHKLPPQWEQWPGSMEDMWAGRTPAPAPYAEGRSEYQWSDFVPRLVHWVQHRGLPLLPDDLLHATVWVEFVDRRLTHCPLPNRAMYEWVPGGAGHYRYRTMVERWAVSAKVARQLGITHAEKEWGCDLLSITYVGGTLGLPEIFGATDKLRLAVCYDLPKLAGIFEKYAAVHPGELDVADLTARLLLHIRKVRGLYRKLAPANQGHADARCPRVCLAIPRRVHGPEW